MIRKINGRDIEVQDMDVLTTKEDFNEYQLSDGTILRIKLVLTDVYRAVKETSPDGSPLYSIDFTPVIKAKGAK